MSAASCGCVACVRACVCSLSNRTIRRTTHARERKGQCVRESDDGRRRRRRAQTQRRHSNEHVVDTTRDGFNACQTLGRNLICARCVLCVCFISAEGPGKNLRQTSEIKSPRRGEGTRRDACVMMTHTAAKVSFNFDVCARVPNARKVMRRGRVGVNNERQERAPCHKKPESRHSPYDVAPTKSLAKGGDVCHKTHAI